MGNPWVVQVSDGGLLLGVYGPFATRRAAQAFAASEADDAEDRDTVALELFRPDQLGELES